VDQIKNKYIPIKQQLEKRSDFFCPAKWTELYLYLNHGNTNSCHHPIPHAIPKELLSDPYVLHNTPHKLAQQQLMTQGQRPKECHMCWHIEDADPNAVSDRLVKSVMWKDQIDHLQVDAHAVPKYIEVVFDNLCNLTCSYCDSGQSSSWATKLHAQDLELKTDYRNLYSKIHLSAKQTNNEYYDAWMRWWPMIKDQVKVLKISGGEPLISPNFWNFFDVLGTAPQLDFQINSNFTVSTDKLKRLVDYSDRFKNILIGVSIDGTGNIAEYSRRGLDFDLLSSNIEYWCQHSPDNCMLYPQSTANIFSIWGHADFLQLFVDLKKKYPHKIKTLYSTVVRFPEFQSIGMLPQDLKNSLYEDINWVYQNNIECFDERAAVYTNKILSYLKNNPKSLVDLNTQDLHADLLKFIDYYDQFDSKRLVNVFPEPFLNWIKSLQPG